MRIMPKIALSLATLVISSPLLAANLDLADAPLYVATTPSPMVMLVMGRDHTLFYEAYNDATDLDGDGELDLNFKPTSITYEGYFDSYRCYTYEDDMFVPGEAADASTKACSGEWSGDFLNYLTMSRMDVLRKVLYGGYRSTDSNGTTVLERAFVPQDAHSWGKSYTSVAENLYDITHYTPYSLPNNERKHFFGTASWSDGGTPKLKVKLNQENDIWNWATTGRPVLDGTVADQLTFNVRVAVCVENKLEDNCKEYQSDLGPVQSSYKPTGLLHDYGEDGSIEFGLITGSFDKNTSGGVLRKVISDFSDEIDISTGVFEAEVDGIVSTINNLRIFGFNYGDKSYPRNFTSGGVTTTCGWINDRPIQSGECASWGNPIGEMLYESLRYFHGEEVASSEYSSGSGAIDAVLGLPYAQWDDPYAETGGRPYCTAAHNLVISDFSPSFDSDELPGATVFPENNENTGSYSTAALTGFNLQVLLNTISNSSNENISGKYFVGESTDDVTGLLSTATAPTAKEVRSLANIRGLSPQEPTKQGSYAVAAAAYYGHKTDLFPSKSGKQNINTTVVSMSSSLPNIRVLVGEDEQEINILPFAKTVGGHYQTTASNTRGGYQPTNTIVDYYVIKSEPTEGEFVINYEDAEQGADHEMDMIVQYTYKVMDDLCPVYSADNSCDDELKRTGVQLALNTTFTATGFKQHAGYVIAGTDKDGIYLDVQKKYGNGSLSAQDGTVYYLDTPEQDDSAFPNNSRETGSEAALPHQRTRNFFPSATRDAEYLPSPLWYAAKWGGFTDTNGNGVPDAGEWDNDVSGEPDNFFPVTNAGQLGAQIGKALEKIASGNQSATPPVFNNTFLNSSAFLYQSTFDGEYWSGDVKAFAAADAGGFSATESWSAATSIDQQEVSSRNIYTRNSESNQVVDFAAPNSLDGSASGLSADQIVALLAGQSGSDTVKLAYLTAVIDYLRGDRTYEEVDLAYSMRTRASALGDVINSTPYYVDSVNGHSVSTPVLVFGANDGMVHIIDADDGSEIMAYIPSQVFTGLNSLTKSTYTHKYFVDGGISGFTDSEGNTTVVGTLGTGFQGLYAIDVSDMSSANKNKIKWEIDTSTTGFSGLGYNRAKPTIAKLANGDTGVIFSNGYNSSVSEGVLYIANLTTGELIETLHTGVGATDDPTGESRPNAMATPAVVDLNSDGIADRVYSGDLYGNMWAFDISSSTSTAWGLATTDDKPLFTATSPDQQDSVYRAQPITTRPSVGAHPYGLSEGVLVAFGTGKYVENADNNAIGEPTQSVYVIWDKLNQSYLTAERSEADGIHVYDTLLRQAIIEEDSANRLLTSYPIDWTAQQGWYLDLVNTQDDNTNNYGERQVTESLLLANKLSFTTLLPNEDICASGGSGWYMEVNLHSGITWNPGTDGNTDPDNEADTINNDSSHQKVDGIPSAPSVIIDTNTDENGVVNEEGIIQKNCITLSNGSIFCFDDYQSPTGRLSLRTLH
ncbi:PilC/PilY family type IV pilus protein [Agarivorans sp. TSD2052]|uniref:pilus assembly protein n=1 Tax=Agarivorans sp. TSD2052 TaxID=2937286 RepID=UPI00200C0147|nr:PilC/PilY family type IV pilus protein [Agarivorans sp. TSD2052]UPW19084.1 PilC/PilY family type IV pilus protein [Agarivorans sp. TSD2052]